MPLQDAAGETRPEERINAENDAVLAIPENAPVADAPAAPPRGFMNWFRFIMTGKRTTRAQQEDIEKIREKPLKTFKQTQLEGMVRTNDKEGRRERPRGAGEHEIFATAHTEEWRARSVGENPTKRSSVRLHGRIWDWLDMQTECRPRTCDTPFPNGAGHTGALSSCEPQKGQGKGTVGALKTGEGDFHKAQWKAIERSSNPLTALIRGLHAQVKGTMTSAVFFAGQKFQEVRLQKTQIPLHVYNVWGHDLKTPEGRQAALPRHVDVRNKFKIFYRWARGLNDKDSFAAENPDVAHSECGDLDSLSALDMYDGEELREMTAEQDAAFEGRIRECIERGDEEGLRLANAA